MLPDKNSVSSVATLNKSLNAKLWRQIPMNAIWEYAKCIEFQEKSNKNIPVITILKSSEAK